MRRHERKRARDLGTRRRRETLHGDRLDGDGPDAGDSAALGLHASECRQGNPRDDPLFFHPGPTSHRDRECHATMDEREMIEATQEKLPELESNQENFQQGHLTRTNFGAIETDGIKLPDIPSPPSPLPPPITFKNVETNKSLEPKPRNGVDLIRAPDLDRSHREIQQSLNKLREEACAIQALRNTEASRASILRHETLLRELNSNPQSTTPHATTTQRQASQPASEIGSEFPAMILAWRIWLAIYMSILSILMGLCVRAIFVDKFPCDEGLWQFTICNASVMMMQIAICLALMFKLPAPALGTILRMTWNVHQRFQHVRAGFLASFFFSLFQIALIPAGIALVKNASDECISNPTETYTYTFYISLFECVVLVCMAIPVCFVPCCFILFDLPAYHGVSPNIMRGITTFTYSDPLPNPIVAVEQEKQNVSVLSQIDKVNAAIRKESILATNSTDTLILSDDGVDLSNIALEYHTSTVIAVEYEMGPEPHKDVDAAFPQAENAVSNPSTDKNVPQAPTSQRTRGSQFRLGKARSARLASSTSRFYGMSGSSSHQASLRDAECAICLEIWKNGDVIKKLKCGHSYHENCLVLWLDEHDQCPMCRYKLQRPSFLSGFSH